MTPAERDFLREYIASLDTRITAMETVIHGIPESITKAVRHCRDERERETAAAEEMAARKRFLGAAGARTLTVAGVTMGIAGTIFGIVMALI